MTFVSPNGRMLIAQNNLVKITRCLINTCNNRAIGE
jgi:hypothetical protein